MMKLIIRLFSLIGSLIRENVALLIGGLIVLVVFLVLGYYVLFPSYMSPKTKFYASGLGYPAMMRKLGKPLPVVTSKAGERTFTKYVMGEGVCSSDPILVPIIPLAGIQKVHFQEGDSVKKGDLMAELDTSLIQVKIESAKLAISTANAELARVKSGSAYVLAQERPKMEKINFATEGRKIILEGEKVERMREAYQKGVLARTILIDAEGEYNKAQKGYEEAKLRLKMAEDGVSKSLQIAQNAVRDAEEALRHRQLELKNYQIIAPVDGIIERVLVKEGEYNSDPGKPGFVVVSGLWFDTFFDQSDFAYVKKEQSGEIRLEAYPGVSHYAKVSRITPVVSFNEGGPEISRPLRPRGSGAPEWAATFRTQLMFSELKEHSLIAMGMTGFARLAIQKQGIAVPRSALLSVSAGAGILYLPTAENQWEARKVEVGIVDDYAAEILSGIKAGEDVIVEGHWILREADRIEITEEKDFDYLKNKKEQ